MLSSAPVLGALAGDSRSAPGHTGFGPYAHGCWAYQTDAERARAACEWLTDGLRQHYRGVYVADEPVDDLIAELAGVPNRDEALRNGALLVFSTSDLYDLSAPIDAQAQLAVYAGAVEQALRDGFQGVRVAADISALVEDPARRAAHAHWEQVADRYISQHPLAPLCMYDTRRVGDIETIVGAHPLQGPAAAPFSLYATQPHGAALTGEIDLACHGALRDLLAGQPESDRVIDTSGLTFLDGHAAWLLHAHLADRHAAGNPVVLSSPPEILRRVWTVSGFDAGYLG
jgi:anti-anti-sigma regulatory factor